MDIRLNDDKPVLYRPYRMSFNKCEQVKDNVQELIATDIMESTHGCRVHREEKEVLIRRVVPPQVPGQVRQAKTSIERHQRRNRRRPRRPRRQQRRPGRRQHDALSGEGPVAQQSVRSYKTICVVDRV
jgi:hypothetical protein